MSIKKEKKDRKNIKIFSPPSHREVLPQWVNFFLLFLTISENPHIELYKMQILYSRERLLKAFW
jgi:hypothetical protein